jgi:hypothetical protein
MLSSTNPTILVHLANFVNHRGMTDHMRVIIHVPKKRDKLDYALVDRNTRIAHTIPPNVAYADYLVDNFLFQLNTPTPFYKLVYPAHVRHPDESVIKPDGFMFDLSLPVVKPDPSIKIHTLGSVEIAGELHDVIGAESIGVIMNLKHPSRKESVCYTLSTARGTEPDVLIDHLSAQLVRLGFSLTYQDKGNA